MEQKSKVKMESGLSKSVDGYVNIGLTDAEKAKAQSILLKDIKMLNEEEALKNNDELKKVRQNFEIKKGEAQIQNENRRTKLEELRYSQQVKNESSKIKLETKKVDNDIKVKRTEIELGKAKQKSEDKKEDARLKIEMAKHVLDSDKFIFQKQNENEALLLEVKKFEHSKTLEELKLKLEAEKIQLEYAKLEIEKEIKLGEQKKDKKTFFVNALMKTLEIFVPLAINAGLVMMNFRLIYADDGRTPSEMKDLMKNVYRK